MKTVLTILGISVVILALAIAFGSKKELSPTPQDDAEIKRQQDEQRDQAEEAKKRPLDLGKSSPESSASSAVSTAPRPPASKDDPVATLTIAGRGAITIELFKKDAP